ncbi:hypothetical protein MRX96_021403 [Rhipicephalus microplus]
MRGNLPGASGIMKRADRGAVYARRLEEHGTIDLRAAHDSVSVFYTRQVTRAERLSQGAIAMCPNRFEGTQLSARTGPGGHKDAAPILAESNVCCNTKQLGYREKRSIT